jgi:hypothetical protein
MTCRVCARPLEAAPVHPECLPSALLAEALLAAVELIAVVVAPAVIVWGA